MFVLMNSYSIPHAIKSVYCLAVNLFKVVAVLDKMYTAETAFLFCLL